MVPLTEKMRKAEYSISLTTPQDITQVYDHAKDVIVSEAISQFGQVLTYLLLLLPHIMQCSLMRLRTGTGPVHSADKDHVPYAAHEPELKHWV